MRRSVRLALGVVLIAATAVAAAAQPPPGVPPGHLRRRLPPGPPGAGAPGEVAAEQVGPSAYRVRTLGGWLDDASALGIGEVWLSVAGQHWASPVLSGRYLPVIGASAGVADRVAAAATIPVVVPAGGSAGARGIGDSYFGVRVVLRDPAVSGVGVAVAPTLEWLSSSTAEAIGRARGQLVLPVSVERRWRAGRTYATGSYLTRGVLGAGAGIEGYLSDRWAVAGWLSTSRSVDGAALATEIGLRRWRADAGGSLAYVVSPALVVHGGVSRTVSPLDADSTRYAVSAGAAVGLHARTRPRVR